MVRRLVKVALAAWVGRWAARQLAAYSGRHWQSRGRAPKDWGRQPGRMPGPDD